MEPGALDPRSNDTPYFDVVFCTGRISDLMLMATAGRSLLENCSQPSRVRFHLLSASLGPCEFERVIASWSDFQPVCTYYSLAEYWGARVEDPLYGYWYWMALGQCLSDAMTRVLYLDCDVLVLGDIAELWELQLDDKVMAAVQDPWGKHYFRSLSEYGTKVGLEYPVQAPYYNAGVLFINLRSWRKERVWERCEDIFDTHRSNNPTSFHDQTELNLLLWHRTLSLDPSWNLIENLPLYEGWDFGIYQGFDPKEYFQPKIRHFAGADKATSFSIRLSEKQQFYGYLDRTKWAGWRSESDQTLRGRCFAELLELHYICIRGFKQKALSQKWEKLARLLAKSPYLAIFYLAVPLNRWRLRLTRRFDAMTKRHRAASRDKA